MGDPGRRETRTHPRHDVDIRVDWSTGQMFVSAHGGNLSEGGLFLRTDGPMPDGEVSLILMLPGGAPVRAKGRVVWSRTDGPPADHRAAGCGLQFLDMSVVDRAMLLDYLRELTTRAPRTRGH